MYQFSLFYYSKLFNNVIMNAKPDENRIEQLKKSITDSIFDIICRGLFNRHKKIFSFVLAAQIALQEKTQFNVVEWNFLIKGTFIGKTDFIYPPEANFSDAGWQVLNYISKKEF